MRTNVWRSVILGQIERAIIARMGWTGAARGLHSVWRAKEGAKDAFSSSVPLMRRYRLRQVTALCDKPHRLDVNEWPTACESRLMAVVRIDAHS